MPIRSWNEEPTARVWVTPSHMRESDAGKDDDYYDDGSGIIYVPQTSTGFAIQLAIVILAGLMVCR